MDFNISIDHDEKVHFNKELRDTLILLSIYHVECSGLEYEDGEYCLKLKNYDDIKIVNLILIMAEINSYIWTFEKSIFMITMKYEEFSESLNFLMEKELVKIYDNKLIVSRYFFEWMNNKILIKKNYNKEMHLNVSDFIKNNQIVYEETDHRNNSIKRISNIFNGIIINNDYIDEIGYKIAEKEYFNDTWFDKYYIP